jgi:hypothetical protein
VTVGSGDGEGEGGPGSTDDAAPGASATTDDSCAELGEFQCSIPNISAAPNNTSTTGSTHGASGELCPAGTTFALSDAGAAPSSSYMRPSERRANEAERT